MNLYTKKKLAEWMGWDINNHPNVKKYPSFFKNWDDKTKTDGFMLFLNMDWNPDTDHKQFTEVWNKITVADKRVLYDDSDPTEFSINMLLNDLSGVMEIVLEVLGIPTEAPTINKSSN